MVADKRCPCKTYVIMWNLTEISPPVYRETQSCLDGAEKYLTAFASQFSGIDMHQ